MNGVFVGRGVRVAVRVGVGVAFGFTVGVRVAVGLGVIFGVGVRVGVGFGVGVRVGESVGDGVGVAGIVGVRVEVGVGVGVGGPAWIFKTYSRDRFLAGALESVRASRKVNDPSWMGVPAIRHSWLEVASNRIPVGRRPPAMRQV